MKRTKQDHLRSPIFSLFGFATLWLHRLNIVEWLKWGVKAGYQWLTKVPPSESAAQLDPITTDSFIVGKWALLLWWLLTEAFSSSKAWVVAYLLFTNVFTYFHYHAWKIMAVGPHLSAERIQRRLVNSLLAVAFSMVAFAYLYAGLFRGSMLWGTAAQNYRTEALLFSIANSLTVGYGAVQPGTTGARALCTAQLVNMFFFATIIVSASLSSMFGASSHNSSKE